MNSTPTPATANVAAPAEAPYNRPRAPKRGKRYAAARALVDRTKDYSLAEALHIAKQTSNVQFDASVEIHCNLGIDPKRAEQTVRFSLQLPHSTGRTRRIAVFTTPAHEAEATQAGADIVGGDELVKTIQKTGKCSFDVAVATPDFMKNLAAIARILGQKGLMPSPKNETVTTNIAKTVRELAGGKQTFRSDDSANIHALVGKTSMADERLSENITAFLAAVKRAKPADAKGTYLRSITLATAMGPGIRVRP